MHRSTSPVGPLIVAALLCVASAAPVHADDVRPGEPVRHVVDHETVDHGIEAGALRGSVDASAWSFLDAQNSSVHVEDLPAPVAPVAGLDGQASEKTLSDEERAKLGEALLAPLYSGTVARKPLRTRKPSEVKADGLEVSRAKGTGDLSTVVFNKPIAPATGAWKAKVGADLGMTTDASIGTPVHNPLRAQRDARSANAAWASVDVHEFATVDARVNPGSDQGMVATTFKKSVPIGSDLSMSLQSRTSMTETFGRGTPTSDIPMMALPSSDGTTTPRVWGQENTARLNVLATGTTFGAGLSSSSTDTVTHNTLSAEQKLYGPVSVSTAITDVGQTGESKSVSARAKFNW